MTTFTTNTDLDARGRQLAKARTEAGDQVWSLLSGLPKLFAGTPVDPEQTLAKMERREAARRAADNLLLR